MAENQNPTDDAPRTWKVGDVIADLYEVTGVLGEGAFGIVHKVHHRGWNMDLAVKSPKEEILWNENAVRRFLREAETWVTLGLYPHIASCYYVRVLGGLPRMFIEYADGGTLRDWLNDGKVKDWHTILDIAIQICYGLSFAHKKGLVHRDLKPGNCLMMSDGTLKLTDFGLVKAVLSEDLPSAGDMTRIGDMTGTASVPDRVPRQIRDRVPGPMLTAAGRMGTPEYMAPEQWSNPATATAAADIWAFGVMLYELTCGKRPFEMQPDEPEDAFCARMVKSNWAYPNPRELRSDMPQRQVEVVTRCLSPTVEERPQDVEVIAAEIDQLCSDFVDVMPSSSARRPPPEIPSLADTLNNQAVSLIDLGREDDALRLLDEALKVEPAHVHATFNQGLLWWRGGRITDMEALGNLKALREVRPLDYDVSLFIGQCHIERGDAESAIAELEEARRLVTDSGTATDAQAVTKALGLAERMQQSGESGRCLRTFEGHTEAVLSVCISPDGRYGLSGSGDGTIRLWDLASGKCLRAFEDHANCIWCVCISPDGRHGLSGGSDKTLQLWELATGRCVRTFDGHTGGVESVCISPDGRFGLSGSEDGTLRLWELATGRCLRMFVGHTDDVRSVCISPNGRYGLSGSWDNNLRLWELATGSCLMTLEGHTDLVTSVCISPDGRFGLSGSEDRTLRLWELATGECLRTFEGHTSWVLSVYNSPDGRRGLSGSNDATVRLWDLATGKCLRTFGCPDADVWSVCISPDGRYGLSGSRDDHAMRLWTLGTGETAAFSIVRPRRSAQGGANELAFGTLLLSSELALSDGRPREAVSLLRKARQLPGYERSPRALKLLTTAGRSAIRVGLASAWATNVLHGRVGGARSACISPDGRYGLTGGHDRTLRLWKLATGECSRTFEGHTKAVNAVCISPDGRYGLSGSYDRTIRLWELATGTCLRVFEGHTSSVYSVCISPDGRHGLSSGKTLRLWELVTGRCLRAFEGHTYSVESVCISPDGRYGLSGSDDNTLRLWGLGTGRCLRAFEGHTDSVKSVCISSDGRYGLSGGDDNTLRLWELATGKCLRVFQGLTACVGPVCISPDGRYGLSGDGDKTLQVLELATGKCTKTLVIHDESVCSMSLDGRYALSCGAVRLWEFEWECEFPEPKDWDDGARPYLETFLTLHMRVGLDGISRVGKSVWNDDDFENLLAELGYRGYGWLRPEGVRRQLEKMTSEWKGPPELPGG
jgi:WD40 repeat protein